MLAPQTRVVVRGDALEVADRQRIVEVLAATRRFAHRETGAPKDPRERQSLAHHRDRLAVLAFRRKLHVTRHVDAGRTGVLARHHRLFALGGVERAVHQRTRRAHGHTGLAEGTAGFDQSGRDGADVGALALRRLDFLHLETAHAAHVVTGDEAATAIDAQVVVAIEERLVLDDRQLRGLVGRRRVRDADVVGDLAQLTGREDRAAARLLRVAVGALRARTAVALRTGEADVRVRAEDLRQVRLAHGLDRRRRRRHDHAGRDGGRAGLGQTVRTLDLDHAQVAAALARATLAGRGKIGVCAQCRNVQARGSRRIQDRRARRCLDLDAVDAQLHRRAELGHPDRLARLPPPDFRCLYGFHVSLVLYFCAGLGVRPVQGVLRQPARVARSRGSSSPGRLPRAPLQ